MKVSAWIGTLAAAGLIAVAAQAQTSKTPEQQKAYETAQLTGHANYTNRECGTSITVSFDWAGVQDVDLAANSANRWCNAALEGIRNVCVDAPGKEAVKEKIKAVTCGFGPERTISLKDGVVEYKMNFKSSNDADFVFESLENAL